MIPRNSARCSALHVRVVEHQLGEGADRGQRRAELVGDRGHEVVLQVVEALQLLVGGAELAGRLLERARLLLERAGVAAELRGLVEDLEHVVDRERLLLGDRFDHDPRRGGADGAGDLALHPVDEAGVGDEVGDGDADLAGVLVEERAGAGGAEEAAGEGAQVVEPGAAAPEHRLGAAAAEDVDEEQRLARLAGRGAAGEREADVEREVDRQAPEQRVGEVVEAGQAEQPLGGEERDPERAVLEEVRGDPAGLRHRGQHQRVGPDGEAAERGRRRRRRRCRRASRCRRGARGRTGRRRRS